MLKRTLNPTQKQPRRHLNKEISAMNPFYLNGESKYVEYKKAYSKTISKTVSAFANYHEGVIVTGISDKNEVTGVPNMEALKLSIENLINDTLVPKPYFELFEIQHQGKDLLVIKVYKSDNTPYTIEQKTYRRMDTSTVQVDKYGYEDLVLKGRNLSFEALPYDGGDLYFTILEAKLRARINIKAISEDIMKSLELIKGSSYTNVAALLSDENPIQNAGLVLVRFDGDSVLNIKDMNIVRNVSVITQYDKCIDFFQKHINSGERIDGPYRRSVPEIPLMAFREAIVNAIVHRDYARAGEIRVEIFDSRLEIISPGGLPIGISEEEYLDGRISIPRNRILCDIFLRLTIIERLATGVRRIREYYKEYSQTPIFQVAENSIKVVLPKLYSSPSVNTIKENSPSFKEFPESIKTLYEYISKNGKITRAEAEQVLNLKKTQTVEILNIMQHENILIKTGIGKGTRYQIR